MAGTGVERQVVLLESHIRIMPVSSADILKLHKFY